MSRGKRALDVAVAAVGLVALSPLLALLAAAVALDGGPIFFRQERVGRRGRPFRIAKFRTMVPDADRLGAPLTVAGDRRITRVGRVLRAAKLDELPQLWNVLTGEMSLVGPRPEVPRYVALYTEEQARVLALTPGITDPASIRYRHEEAALADSSDPERAYLDVIMPEKIRINLEYAARASVGSDLAVIVETLVALF